jgi:threonine dehydratase
LPGFVTIPWSEAAPPSFEDVLAARERIAPHVHRTPVMTSRSLDQLTSARLVFKCENLQRSGAFKVRGAFNAVLSLSDRQASRGVATHSSGNHGAALAMAAAQRGVPAYIVVPASAVPGKRDAVARWGATLIDCEATLNSRTAALAGVLEDTGAHYVAPFDDPRVIAGQGTAALELLEDAGELNQVWIPVGGGGLASGTAIVTAARYPESAVVAAEPVNADDTFRSIETGALQPMVSPDTIADGLQTSLSPLTFGILRDHGVRVALASEQAIRRAQELIMARMKLVVEPSAAVPLAAMLEDPDRVKGQSVGVILSGGNTDGGAVSR